MSTRGQSAFARLDSNPFESVRNMFSNNDTERDVRMEGTDRIIVEESMTVIMEGVV